MSGTWNHCSEPFPPSKENRRRDVLGIGACTVVTIAKAAEGVSANEGVEAARKVGAQIFDIFEPNVQADNAVSIISSA